MYVYVCGWETTCVWGRGLPIGMLVRWGEGTLRDGGGDNYFYVEGGGDTNCEGAGSKVDGRTMCMYLDV